MLDANETPGAAKPAGQLATGELFENLGRLFSPRTAGQADPDSDAMPPASPRSPGLEMPVSIAVEIPAAAPCTVPAFIPTGPPARDLITAAEAAVADHWFAGRGFRVVRVTIERGGLS